MSPLKFTVLYCILCAACLGIMAAVYATMHKIMCDKADATEKEDGE